MLAGLARNRPPVLRLSIAGLAEFADGRATSARPQTRDFRFIRDHSRPLLTIWMEN